MTKFKIGDEVWRPTWDARENWVTCPDCGGTGRLRVTFHDETTVSIGCANCSVGYDPPRGKVKCYDRQPDAQIGIITGMEIDGEKVEYRIASGLNSYWRLSEDELSFDRDEALAKAQAKAEAADAEERARISKKEKDTRTWAWNASYHRQCIKRATRDLEYHTAKLNVAALKAKEDRAEKAQS